MKNAEAVGGVNPDYKLALKLATIAYDQPGNIAAQVRGQTAGQYAVVWGPVMDQSILAGEYSLMYVAKHIHSNNYHVAIRGTHRASAYSWIWEDFDVGVTKPFSDLPGIPNGTMPNALISKGTFEGMKYLINMKSPYYSPVLPPQNVVEFLKASSATDVHVTGHSLGGTLTPVMYAFLNYFLNPGTSHPCNMHMISFAGLPPGGSGFNSYLSTIGLPTYKWRVRNTLDIAPLMWLSKSAVTDIYSFHGVYPDTATQYAIDHYFYLASQSGITYAQPGPEYVLPGVFDPHHWHWFKWSEQAAHQHGTATYLSLLP